MTFDHSDGPAAGAWNAGGLALGFGNTGPKAAPRLVKSAIKLPTTRRLRRRALALQRRVQLGSPRPPDEQLMLDLRRRFRGEVVALSEYMNRDMVKLWGYDRLD